MKHIIFYFTLFFCFSSCCGIEEFLGDDDGCLKQIFTETRKSRIASEFSINDKNGFIYANKLTAAQIRSGLDIPDNATIKDVSFNSAKAKYIVYTDNGARTMFANLAVVTTDGGFNFTLIKEQNLFVPLITGETAINSYLNSEGVKEVERAITRYGTNTIDSDLSFIFSANNVPATSLAHFKVTYEINITIVFEVCRFAPLGHGERVCE